MDKLTSLQSGRLFRASFVLTTEKANKHQEVPNFSSINHKGLGYVNHQKN